MTETIARARTALEVSAKVTPRWPAVRASLLSSDDIACLQACCAAREGSSLWWRAEPSLLARLLEELQAARPPLEELRIEG